MFQTRMTVVIHRDIDFPLLTLIFIVVDLSQWPCILCCLYFVLQSGNRYWSPTGQAYKSCADLTV